MRSILFRLLIILITALIVDCNIFAKTDNGLPGYFMEQGIGARALGLGRSFVSVSDDVSATYWNAAGLNQLNKDEVQYMYVKLFEDTSYNSFCYAHPFWNDLTLGGAITQLKSTGFVKRDIYNNPCGEFSNINTLMIISGSYKVKKDMSFGIAYKSINTSIDTFNSSTYAWDISSLYRPASALSIGLNVQSFVSGDIKREIITDKIPMNVKIGVSYKLLGNRLLLTTDLDKSTKSSLRIHSGIEYSMPYLIKLRGGYDIDTFTAGFGSGYKNYYIDYAFYSHPYLDASHRVSVGTRFGEAREDVRNDHLNDLLREADSLFNNKHWDASLHKYAKVLNYGMNSEHANSRINQINQKKLDLSKKYDVSVAFYEKQMWDNAKKELTEILEMDPDNKKAKWLIGKLKQYVKDKTRILNIAVSEFAARDVSAATAVTVSDFIRSELVKREHMNVVDRSNMEMLLAEQRFQLSGCTSEECAAKIGKILNVNKVIVGNVSNLLGTFYIVANVVNVENGRIECSEKDSAATPNEIVGACERIAHKIGLYYMAEKEKEEVQINVKKGQTKINMAVSEFNAKDLAAVNAAIVSDYMRSELVKKDRFTIVNRDNMNLLLLDKQFQLSGCTSQECAVKMGKILNVNKVMVGNVVKLIDTYYVDINIIDVETGRVEFSNRKGAGTFKELLENLSELIDSINERYSR